MNFDLIKSLLPYLVAAGIGFTGGMQLQGIETQRVQNELDGLTAHQAFLRNEAVAANLALKAQQQENLDATRQREADLPAIRAAAVAAYLRRLRDQNGVHGDGVPAAGAGNSPDDTAAAQCVPDREFIADCADDAANLAEWQAYGRLNKLPVK